MIVTLISIPFLGVLLLALQAFYVNTSVLQKRTVKQEVWLLRKICLLITVLAYLYSIIIYINFDILIVEMQFTQTLSSWSIGSLSFGLDQISLFFVLLTTVTMPIVILSGFYSNLKQARLYLILMLIFEGFILIVFTSLDLILFYVSFEAVLIPLVLLVGVFGGLRRVQAAFLLFIYTLFGSLPMLLSVLSISNTAGTTHLQLLTIISPTYNTYVWLGIFLALAIKAPIVPFHLWLRIAHSEGNTPTSIILAGLVLKMATYGFLRILIGILPTESSYFSPLVIVLSLISVIYTSFSCLRQTDFKQLVAYSSIGHMSIAILGLFSNTVTGIEGGIMLGLAHGFVSPALFFLLGGVVYDRYHTRIIRYYRGLSIYMPLFAVFFFIFTIANSGTPLTANWIGEFLSLAGSFQSYPFVTLLASLSIFLSSVYSIYLFNRISFGQWSKHLIPVLDVSRQEFHVLWPLFFFTVLLGVYPNFVLDSIHLGVSSLIY